uniref:CSON005647 protein n=1 Tax=Culicoides sonorensis TaxID=179676 RepID=A0A336LWD5_CULSO
MKYILSKSCYVSKEMYINKWFLYFTMFISILSKEIYRLHVHCALVGILSQCAIFSQNFFFFYVDRCKAIYCDPPYFCKDFRLGDKCCEWTCLDKPGENALYELRIKKRAEILAGVSKGTVLKLLNNILLFDDIIVTFAPEDNG